MASNTEIGTVLGFLASVFPHAHLDTDERTVAAWAILLADVPDGRLMPATHAALLTRDRGHGFPPDPGELRRMALLGLGDGTVAAYEAWAEVQAAIGQREPRVSPATQRAIDLACGGWAAFGRSENLMADRARFLECYRALEAGERQRALLPDATRRALGHATIDEKGATSLAAPPGREGATAGPQTRPRLSQALLDSDGAGGAT